MALDFATTPSVGDITTISGKSWRWNGSGWAVINTAAREKLSANRTYNVPADFATMQIAYDYIVSNLDQAGYTVTIQLADNTYGAGITANIPPTGPVTVLGNTGTRANVHISKAGGDCFNFDMRWFGPRIAIKSLKMSNSSGNCIYGVALAHVGWDDVDFGACAGSAHVDMRQGSKGFGQGNYVITGAAAIHTNAPVGQAYIEYPGGGTITVSGTPAFSGWFARASAQSQISAFGVTFSGAATGTRYFADNLGFINTFGGGASYFPGNAGGTADAATFSVYA